MFISTKKASLIVSMMVLVSLLFTACTGSPSAPAATQAIPGTGPQATATVAGGASGGTTAATPTTAAGAAGAATPTGAAGTAGTTTTPAATASAAGTASGVTPTAAAGAAGAGAQAGPAKNPDTMIEANIGEPESLDPAWAYDTASGEVIFNVYETLLFPKKESPTDFVPMLATKWDISQDGKTYTFTIRQGVKFHDGSTLTPQDVAYSFWRGMIQDRSGGPQWIMLEPFFGLNVQSYENDVVKAQFGGDWVKAANAVEQAITFDNNAGTVTMHLKQPYGPMLQILTGSWASIVSMPWVVKQGGWDGKPADAQKFHDPSADKDELFKVMNGTGPYKFTRWAPGEEIDLDRNDTYWSTQALWDGGPSGPAKMAHAVIKYISEWGTRFATFQTGDADLAYVDTQYVSQVDPLVGTNCDATGSCQPGGSGGGTLKLYKNLPTVSNAVIFFNEKVNTTGGNNNTIGSGKLDGNGVPPDFFADVNVRKGFNYCFDWDTFIKQVWNGEAVQNYGPIIKGELGYDANQAHYTFDATKCADAFKASTLKSADGKSLWDTGFYVQFVYNSGNDQRKTAGEILAQNLKKVNPKFNVAVVDEPFALELSNQTAGNLALFMIGWLEDFHDPHDWVVPFLASGGTYSGTQSFPKDVQTQLDQLIQQGVQESNKDARAKIYSQIQNLSYENALDLFVDQPLGRQYMQGWVNGWYYNPTYPGIYFYALSK
jgi:peptide/nickel transport system substrate-binding protein